MYEIKVLSSDEFDKVAKSDPRYSYVDDTNMGFADREKGLAYVRGTNVHDLNKYLINHELEELEHDDSTHEDANGIRHKKFFKEMFLPFITGGLVSGGQTGGVFNLGRKENKFDPFGVIGSKGETVDSSTQGTMKSPFGMFGISPDTFSGGGSSFNSSPRVSETVTGGIQSGINQNQQSFDGIQGLPPDLLQRLKGSPSGRYAF